MPVMVRNIAVSYASRKVLSNISAMFPDGQLVAVTGPSGAGKTTLLGAIGGIVPLASGNIEVNGLAPRPELSVWVPQGANCLTSRTLMDNVMIAPLSDGIPRAEAQAKATMALEQVGLGARGDSRAAELSGGELQRLALARALASARPVVLLDEPTANLDPVTASGIITLLKNVPVTNTMIVSTHDSELVDAADAVLDLRQLARSAVLEP
ncbi:MAG: ATP-binding cassette domain-containing protein [Leucobacter sp.]